MVSEGQPELENLILADQNLRLIDTNKLPIPFSSERPEPQKAFRAFLTVLQFILPKNQLRVVESSTLPLSATPVSKGVQQVGPQLDTETVPPQLEDLTLDDHLSNLKIEWILGHTEAEQKEHITKLELPLEHIISQQRIFY